MAVYTIDKKWVYIDQEDKILFNGSPGDFSEGLVYYNNAFISKSGEVTFELPDGYKIEGSTVEGLPSFQYGLLLIRAEKVGSTSFGILNKQGDFVFESDEYSDVKIFRDNQILVQKDNKWGVITPVN